MNWDAISFDWNQVRAFLAAAEEGSFSAAARALRTAQPTVGRQVAGLEEALGVTLFERAGRRLALTGAGRDLLAHVRSMGDAATRISLTASGQSQDLTGEVSITAADLFAVTLLPPILGDLRRKAPGLRIRVHVSNQIEDLTRRAADIALRHVRPEQPDLIARHIADFSAAPWASQAYVQEMGAPQTVQDLSHHRFLSAGDDAEMLGYMHGFGWPVTQENMVYGSANGVTLWGMMMHGLGICIVPNAMAEGVPGLVRLLPQEDPISFPLWLTTHRELHTSARIRVVYDHLAECLKRPREFFARSALR